jgi:beta-glucanase (GH16 family)
MTIDYAAANVVVGPNGASLVLEKNGDGSTVAQGVRMSTTRYLHYGRFSVEMTAIPVNGVVTTFITMSPSLDEIDW